MQVRCSTCFGTKKTLGLGMQRVKCPGCDGKGQIEIKDLSEEPPKTIKDFEKEAEKVVETFVPPSQKEMKSNDKKKGRK